MAGGFRVNEPAADLAIILALASSLYNRPLDPQLVAIGEVGLSGELRTVPQVERRVTEAARLGLNRCILPETARDNLVNMNGIDPVFVRTVRQALRAALGTPKRNRAPDVYGDVTDIVPDFDEEPLDFE